MRIGPAAIACLAVLVLAPAAQGAQRYAAPAGVGPEPCLQAAPCSLTDAVKKAKTGDEVIVTAGSYLLPGTASPEGIVENLNIHGDFGAPMPTMSTATGAPPISLTGVGGRVSYLEIVNNGTTAFGLSCVQATVERMLIRVTGQFSAALGMGAACIVRDSVLSASGQVASALTASGFTGMSTGTVRNVTAIASGSESVGIRASANGIFPIMALYTLDMKNTIARGGKTDLLATGFEGSANVLAANSNFDKTEAMPPSAVTDQGGNQTAPPLFVDAGSGDYRQAAGSPTIDAGAADPQLGALDPDGNPRIIGAAPDIGAFELVPPPPVAPERPAVGQIRSLVLKPKAFRTVNAGGAILSKRKGRKVPVGTTVTYSLSAVAEVEFAVEKVVRGRRAGKRCVKQTRANRRKKACRRFRRLKGGFTHAGAAGPNSFKFSGRIRSRALRPGSYRLTGATAAASRSVGFKIVR